MKKFKVFMTLSVLMTIMFIGGCGSSTEPAVDQFAVLTDYLAANNMDLTDLLDGWIISADDLFALGTDNYFIMDIRAAADFAEGHIPGAHNTTLADVVNYEIDNNNGLLPVVVVCYTGQTAGHAVAALRLSGVADAQVLKWGMSGWHSDFDHWTANVGDAANDFPAGWSEDASPEVDSYDFPVLDTGSEDGAGILAYQIDHVILDGFKGVTSDVVLANYDDYQIINYWADADYQTYGHITGAFQVTPGTLDLDSIDMLDPDKDIVIYCWTGQTASVVTAWLNVLGYNAYDLKFGANGLIYDDLLAHKWDVNNVPDYDFEIGG